MKKQEFDVIIITAEHHEDHPLSPSGIIARVLQAKGYTTGIIEKPEKKEDFARLGKPRLFFAVSSGSVDSMINNYTPLKKKRVQDEFSKTTKMPDRAVIVYCNRIRELFRESRIVIGGVEASLRRFAHYDYMDNAVRRSILLDSRADVLVYGNGEKQILEICERMKRKAGIDGIKGTCIISKHAPEGFDILPSYDEVRKKKEAFCRSHIMFSNYKNLAQRYDNNFVLQFSYPEYTPKDLDWIYSLPYSRNLRKGSLLRMAQFSVATHRGCFGRCSFCSIALHQGDRIISRSEKSIADELKKITMHPEFKGYIDDLGGPTANMYGMDCRENCGRECIRCEKTSHKRLIKLLRDARKIKGIKKIFIRSGVRYDLALKDREYIREISKHHISGCLKIAPEHFSDEVLGLMNKSSRGLDEFVSFFNSCNRNSRQSLRYYLMICHPGENRKTIKSLIDEAKKLRNIEQFQMFTPTPMSISSCMYWTGLNPYSLKKIEVIYDYKTKKEIKREFLNAIGKREK